MKHSKKFNLLKMCIEYFWRNTSNHVKTDVPKKDIYLASQYDELLAVSVQIYKIRTYQSNVPHDKFAFFFPFYCTFSKSNSMSESQQQVLLTWPGNNSFQIASILPLD